MSEAAHEARDNVKFLATLDQSIAPLHTATLPELLHDLPALFASLHTLQNASRWDWLPRCWHCEQLVMHPNR